MNKSLNVIDLFCGAGGLSEGFSMAGFNIVYAVESNKIYASSFKLNKPNTELYIGDIKNISDDDIFEIKKKNKIDLIIGGPPCQGFSQAGNIGRKFLEDPRNKLFMEYYRFVKIIRPKMFLIENVSSLVKHNKGKTISEIIKTFENIGYKINYKILNSVNYNVPQERRRVFIVGSIDNENFEFPVGNNRKISIKEAIEHLPVLKSGEKSNIPLHNAMNHSNQMLEKMKYVKDGGNRFDIPEAIRPKSGDVRKYIRYNSAKPSFCITGDMRKVFHYSQNRALTCKELAILQTFPNNYSFVGSSISIQQQIGNAVPCNLSYAIAIEFKKRLI